MGWKKKTPAILYIWTGTMGFVDHSWTLQAQLFVKEAKQLESSGDPPGMINQWEWLAIDPWKRWYILIGDMFDMFSFVYYMKFVHIYIHISSWIYIRHDYLECIRVFIFKYMQVCKFMRCVHADMCILLVSVEILARFHTFSPEKAVLSKGLSLFMRLVWKKTCKSVTYESTSICKYIYVYIIYIRIYNIDVDIDINLSIYT